MQRHHGIISFLFILISVSVDAQTKPRRNLYTYNDVSLADFLDLHVSVIEAYNYRKKRSGKVSGDSSLLFRKTYDASSLTITGIKYIRMDIRTIRYIYNEADSLAFEKSARYVTQYNKKGKDWLDKLIQVDSSTLVYVYGKHGRKIKTFSPPMIENDPKEEWIYDHRGMLNAHKVYVYANVVFSSTHYTYDLQRRLVKMIDSTGLSLFKQGECEILTRTYHYINDSFAGHTEDYLYSRIREGFYYSRREEFDAQGHLVMYCSKNTPGSFCFAIRNINTYKNGRLVMVKVIRQKRSHERLYAYTLNGLLSEEKVVYHGKVRNLNRWFYY